MIKYIKKCLVISVLLFSHVLKLLSGNYITHATECYSLTQILFLCFKFNWRSQDPLSIVGFFFPPEVDWHNLFTEQKEQEIVNNRYLRKSGGVGAGGSK